MSAPTTVCDEGARRHVLEDLDATLFVEAGAGTGKTTALVGRLVHLVSSGRAPVRELAAITFTEAAAAELRERIRVELERAARGDTEPPLGPTERQRCDNAIAELDDAPISTLHGFAQRILAEHPLEVGLPPAFEVIDDIQASVAFTERWRRFVDELLDDRALERPLLVACALGLTLRHLEEAARALHLHWDRLPPDDDAPQRPPEIDVAPTVRAVEAAVRHAGDCRAAIGDRLLAHLASLDRWVTELGAATDELDRLAVLADAPVIAPGRMPGNKANWPRGAKDAISELLAVAQATHDAAIGRARDAALECLVHALCSFTLRSVEERRREGRLEFHDLLVMARDLLRSDDRVRAELHERFVALLLDEFQDTDPLQIEIAALVATDEPEAGSRPWPELPVPSGRLFVVGDPKQSIYRFRRADIALYHRVQRVLGRDVQLTRNYRSRPGILAWVDHCFGELMRADDDTGSLQARYAPLVAHRPPLAEGSSLVAPPVHVIGTATDEQTLAELRAEEADELAAAIRQAKVEGWPVSAPTLDDPLATRPANYADIAILVPTRTTVPYLEAALEHADIPVRVESQSMVFATNEVRTLLAILQAIDDPTDEVAIVAALRSPAFGCRDDALVAWKLAGGRFDYRVEPPDDPGAPTIVGDGLVALRTLHDRHVWETVSETVDHVVRERRVLELATAEPRPRDRWRRTRLFVDAARSYASAGGTSLRGFVTWVQQQIDERARIAERVVAEPDDDAVRILTVHGAKGLEFPIVVLTGLNVEYRHRPERALFDGNDRPALRLGRADSGFETARYAELCARDRAGDEHEAVRVLYVAATRARDHLIVSVAHRTGDASAAERLAAVSGTAPHLSRPMKPERVGAGTDATTIAKAPDDGRGRVDRAQRADWLAMRATRLAHGARVPTVAATALTHAAPQSTGAAESTIVEGSAFEPATPSRRGRAGTAIGRAVHATLQTIDLATGAGLEATCRAQALAEGVVDREAEVRALVRSVLAAPTVRTAVTTGRYWREVPVVAEIDGVLLEGFVDLLVDGPDGLVVVDYKTDRIDTDVDVLVARYRLQGAAYALALETTLERRVARCVFVFAGRHGAVERAVDDLPATIDEARAVLPAAVASLGSPPPKRHEV